MQEFYMITGQNLEPLDKEPRLSDVYAPSQDQMNCELLFSALGMGTTGLITYQIFY